MSVYHFLPLFGSLYLCHAYLSQGQCQSRQLSNNVPNYHYVPSNRSFYIVASEASGWPLGLPGYRSSTFKKYIYTKDQTDNCLLISSEALNNSEGHLIEINAPSSKEITSNFEKILLVADCNRTVREETLLWRDSNLLFFWMCKEYKDSTNIQYLFVILPTFLKKEISLKAEETGYIETVKSYTKSIENVVIKYLDEKLLESIIFHWNDIITRSLSKPPTMGTAKLLVIIIFLAFFGISFCVTIFKLK